MKQFLLVWFNVFIRVFFVLWNEYGLANDALIMEKALASFGVIGCNSVENSALNRCICLLSPHFQYGF
ncbi:hypothetical protein IX307_000371 [Bacteroides pyogenes]|uniref:hypothetical protein n=1 Tax=Bacteroides pyogenes TaxID=310300 RepID=UPI001BAA4A4A|nr:hypothetical protein [Bacteroides pyogenes]MBR8719193.1 hypothetical protein [Bacteroides pyogenes]MBR8724011.1 hypothetical protein [Bacteroides pyogenes]MBR8737560.1 hypothetical protein [Bacteroides pyogenes]MBR8753135.1 hypothetical protein [Bacteroides pyogenes]MBR8786070.1 hypothetical protein [Bacteroides pyogenes]